MKAGVEVLPEKRPAFAGIGFFLHWVDSRIPLSLPARIPVEISNNWEDRAEYVHVFSRVGLD
jgi:hypothetical protein